MEGMPFRVPLKQWILAKFLCDRVYFWAIFYATGYRVWGDLPHNPVTSLVKYPRGHLQLLLVHFYIHSKDVRIHPRIWDADKNLIVNLME